MGLTESKKKTIFDCNDYLCAVASGANAINNRKSEINELNVFPVPDGDTGSNMSMTMGPARTVDCTAEGSLADCSDKIAKQFLKSARGNSGVILALFFRGVAKGFREKKSVDASELVSALRSGVEEAYKAVQFPTEGTILTVMRKSVEACMQFVSANEDCRIVAFFEHLLSAAEDTLRRTPEMLPVLKQANVVDAGGAGFVCIVEGMLLALKGKPVIGDESEHETSLKADFAQFDTENIENPYCTECIVTKSEAFVGENKVDEFRRFIHSVGDSAVFVDDEEIIKVHVHTKDPGKVLSEALRYGTLFTVKVENMRNQHTELVTEADTEKNKEDKSKSFMPEKKYGFVAVTPGDGIKDVFDDLGVDAFVFGGQTMNPSTEQLLNAVNTVSSEVVYLLPNNSNICLVATQCANLCKEKNVIVIPTVSVPQGVSAMLAFDSELSPDENTALMEEAATSVTTLEMTFAARDSEFDGNKIKAGQILGLVNHKVRYVTDSKEECFDKMTDNMGDASFITLFYGEDVKEDEANLAASSLRKRLGNDVEVSVIRGGQPLYYYTISVE